MKQACRRAGVLFLILAISLMSLVSCIHFGDMGTESDPDEGTTTAAPPSDPSGSQGDPEVGFWSIQEARQKEAGVTLRTSGVVVRITYSNGKQPQGFLLFDGTQSIYVYDASVASAVRIGDSITLTAKKAYWILADEQANAEKYGYGGCCQLESVIDYRIDASEQTPDYSALSMSTIKEILDTPVSENITSALFKVTALVQKKAGTGFDNYYFYDLDGRTGSYTYTQCNGADFDWLDPFDNKICTVYLTPINAKSTQGECFFRFLPVKVVDEGFVFDLNTTPAHVVDYYGVDQFESIYTGDPAMELTTTVSSTLLGFENATLSYSSSNENVVYFEESDGKIIFHCKEVGHASVSVKGSYDGKSISKTVDITVRSNEEYETISIAQAQAAELGTSVTLRGIVGPSLVNRDGFYLFDESGMIAINAPLSIFDSIEIGQEIVLQGTRHLQVKNDKPYGETCVKDAVLLANYYGEHDYENGHFITDKTLSQLCALPVTEDYTTQVYILSAQVKLIQTDWYTSIALVDGSSQLSLYCANAGQYGFLSAYDGQTVTVELALCNWNSKDHYTGCVLSVITPEGKVLNMLHFQD